MLVAWIVAGNEGTVRILAPNTVIQRRWAEELEAHLEPLGLRTSFGLDSSRLKVGRVGRLQGGRVQVSTHSRFVTGQILPTCDLLIIDEAHRAKGEDCAFNQALQNYGRCAQAMLILTATPLQPEASPHMTPKASRKTGCSRTSWPKSSIRGRNWASGIMGRP